MIFVRRISGLSEVEPAYPRLRTSLARIKNQSSLSRMYELSVIRRVLLYRQVSSKSRKFLRLAIAFDKNMIFVRTKNQWSLSKSIVRFWVWTGLESSDLILDKSAGPMVSRRAPISRTRWDRCGREKGGKNYCNDAERNQFAIMQFWLFRNRSFNFSFFYDVRRFFLRQAKGNEERWWWWGGDDWNYSIHGCFTSLQRVFHTDDSNTISLHFQLFRRIFACTMTIRWLESSIFVIRGYLATSVLDDGRVRFWSNDVICWESVKNRGGKRSKWWSRIIQVAEKVWMSQ